MADIRNSADDARDRNPGAAEQAGEGVGGIGGTLAGAGIGSLAGPIGTVIGGIAGAVGGWWAGEKAGRSLEDMPQHEEHYRTHHRSVGRDDIPYDDARLGYGLGHAAGRNPDYRGRSFDDVESDLRAGWRDSSRDYDTMRPFVRTGFERTSRESSGLSGSSSRSDDLGGTSGDRLGSSGMSGSSGTTGSSGMSGSSGSTGSSGLSGNSDLDRGGSSGLGSSDSRGSRDRTGGDL